MHLWLFISIIGVALCILEILTPTMFFLNLAIGAFLTAIISVWFHNVTGLIVIFVVISSIVLVFLRPLLLKREPKENKTGIEGKYIGKIAKVESEITKNSGVISIYGERWEARNIYDDVIPEGTEARIVRNESLIMFVEKV